MLGSNSIAEVPLSSHNSVDVSIELTGFVITAKLGSLIFRNKVQDEMYSYHFELNRKSETVELVGLSVKSSINSVKVFADKHVATFIPAVINMSVQVKGVSTRFGMPKQRSYVREEKIVIDRELEEFVLLIANM